MLPPTITTTDYHTAGEPFRIVVESPVPIVGSSVAERRAFAIKDPVVQELRAVLGSINGCRARFSRGCARSRNLPSSPTGVVGTGTTVTSPAPRVERLILVGHRHQTAAVTENRSTPPGPVVPGRFYDDVGAAIVWICSAFGFSEIYRYGRPDRPQGAFLSTGNGGAVTRAVSVRHRPSEPAAGTFYGPRQRASFWGRSLSTASALEARCDTESRQSPRRARTCPRPVVCRDTADDRQDAGPPSRYAQSWEPRSRCDVQELRGAAVEVRSGRAV